MSQKSLIPLLGVLCALVVSPLFADCTSAVFSTPQSRTDGSFAISETEAVRIDGDSIMDLVGTIDTVANDDVLHSWRGNGDGTFQTPINLGDVEVADLRVADVNNDGRSDLVMGTWEKTLRIRLNNGTGFDPAIVQNVDYFPNDIVMAFVDGDAFIDMVTTSSAFSNWVIYAGVGNGTFIETRRGATPQFPVSVAVADFDGDSRPDIAYALRIENRVDFLFQNPNGTFAAPVSYGLSGDPGEIQAGDFDENGQMDLAVSTWNEVTNIESSVTVFRNLGSRTFAKSEMLPPFKRRVGNYWSMSVKDVTADGHLDIIAAAVNGGFIVAFPGKGDGTFRSPSYYDGGDHVFSIAIADLDGDTDQDIAFGTWQQLVTIKNSCGPQVYLFSRSPIISVGQSAPMRAAVSGISSDISAPRGTVTFKEGATILGSDDVDANGIAELSVAGLSAGDHNITADFAGNAETPVGTSQVFVQTVTTATTTTTLTLAPSVHGTPFNATVELRQSGTLFLDYYTLIVDGVETEYYSGAGPVTLTLNHGPHTISARYDGSSFRPPSASTPQMIETAKAQPVLSFTGDATVREGEAHFLNFSITFPAGTTPTGAIWLLRGDTILGSGPMSGGSVAISVTLERGSHDLLALYSGDANFEGAALNVTLTVTPNMPLSIEARGLQNAISIRVAVPPGASSLALYRRVAGTVPWSHVSGWPASELDSSATRGVLYEYHVEAVVTGVLTVSNTDPAMLFTDVTLPGVAIKRAHFDELRAAINALRGIAGLSPFNFDGTYAEATVRASHAASMRAALAEAREVLGMRALTVTDSVLTGAVIKAVHVDELRVQSQ